MLRRNFMAKYFSGITINGNKYGISIIDDNLNIIFMDNLEADRLIELLKRKTVTTISIDFPLALYLKNLNNSDQNFEKLSIKKRSFDSFINSRQLFTYSNRFNLNKHCLKALMDLSRQLVKLGFSIKGPEDPDKSIIESYPETSFLALGYTQDSNMSQEDVFKKKQEILKSKGIRLKDYLKKGKKDISIELNTLCQAYTAYLYHSGDKTCFGNAEEGILVIPAKDALGKTRSHREVQKEAKQNNLNIKQPQSRTANIQNSPSLSSGVPARTYSCNKIISEYCGAQYLYTNTDGVIRISELRPIKSYRPFTEIYEIKQIKQVQVIIGTTDGLRKVKANLIPNTENTNSFKAAEEEDKKKLDSFWGNHGDKKGYLIKFNKVEVVKI